MKWQQFKEEFLYVWRKDGGLDWRWSWVAIALMIVIGAIVNWKLPGGWTIWPFVMAVGVMLMVHEAADRNGQGIPPLKGYALFLSVIGVWSLVVMVISALHPVVLFLIVLGIVFYSVHSYLKHLEKLKLIARRRSEGLCIHCGEEADPHAMFCMNCGEEADPEASQRERISGLNRTEQERSRMRQALSRETFGQSASRREKGLLDRRQAMKPGRGNGAKARG